MVPSTTPEELDLRLRAAGVVLTAAEVEALHRGPWARIEAMIVRNAGSGGDRFAEPAAIFDPDAP
jgi:hypothetical protein